MNHILKPNKFITVPYEYIEKNPVTKEEHTYMKLYKYEAEPVIKVITYKDDKTKKIETWQHIPIEKMTDEEVEDYLHFDFWKPYNERKIRSYGLFEVINIFKDDLYLICLDKIYKKEQVTKFKKILNQLKSNNDNEIRLKIEKARSVDMNFLVESMGYKPRMSFIKCLLHIDKTPSLKIYKNSWYCFSCNRGGDSIQFLMDMQHLSFKDAVEFLQNI